MRRRRGLGDRSLASWVHVSLRDANFETVIRPAVWGMFEMTYAKIGLILDHPQQLDEYDVWEVFEDAYGEPRAFRLSKTTPRGLKGGLIGSDGSREGRAAIKEYIKTWYREPGHYAELSHRMEELALEAGAPVVCAAYAPTVLGKQVVAERDGVHYRRVLTNVGEVTKVIIGRPLDIPSASSAAPKCPLPAWTLSGPADVRADRSPGSLLDHLASLAPF